MIYEAYMPVYVCDPNFFADLQTEVFHEALADLKSGVKKCLEICAIKGGGGSDP